MATEAPLAAGPRVRINYVAILIAAIVCFLLEAGWYSFFLDAWLSGIGRSRQWMLQTGINPALQYGAALVAAAVVAIALSCTIQLTGPQTMLRGIRVGALLWVGLVATTWGTEYVFEVRPVSLFAINGGLWLLNLVVMGAIVGGWKKKPAAA
ncbi:MAG TPA: DUF1761 domain-containing protein [Terracidiphilus sp.]|nr:DUF1761 domain-containing protein [Terracidiphilus sp.]